MKGDILKLLEVLDKFSTTPSLRKLKEYSKNVEIEIISSQGPKVRKRENYG